MPVQEQTRSQTLTYRCPHCGTLVSVETRAAGLLLSCPSPTCGKPFRVEVPVAKPVSLATPAKCPPATPTSAPSYQTPVAQVSAVQTPAAPTNVAPAPAHSSHNEVELQTVHLSMFRRYPWRCLGYWLLMAAGIACMIWMLFDSRRWLALLSAAIAAYGALRLFAWWLRMSRTWLTLTDKRAILTTGLFSQQTTEFEVSQLADIHVHQTPLMRWLDVGDVAIVNTNPQQPQIVIMAVPHPGEVAELLQAQIDARMKATSGPLQPGTVVSVPGPVRVE
jgi:hypothetical protein